MRPMRLLSPGFLRTILSPSHLPLHGFDYERTNRTVNLFSVGPFSALPACLLPLPNEYFCVCSWANVPNLIYESNNSFQPAFNLLYSIVVHATCWPAILSAVVDENDERLAASLCNTVLIIILLAYMMEQQLLLPLLVPLRVCLCPLHGIAIWFLLFFCFHMLIIKGFCLKNMNSIVLLLF